MSMMVQSGRFGAGTDLPSLGALFDFPIVNPGAELNNVTMWTSGNVGGTRSLLSITTTGSGWPGPVGGTRYYAFNNSDNGTVFYQTFDIPSDYHADIDAGIIKLIADLFNSSAGEPDSGRYAIRALDASAVELAAFQSVARASINWVHWVSSLKLPANTRKVRIEIEHVAGSGYKDTYFDNLRMALATDIEPATSYANTGGSGNRAGIVGVTSANISIGGGAVANLVNGAADNSFWWNNGANNGTQVVKFDFASAKIITAFRWNQDVSSAHGFWSFEGSNDDATYTPLALTTGMTKGVDPSSVDATKFELVSYGGWNEHAFVNNTTAYRYYQLRAMEGNRSQAPYCREIEFKID